MTLISTFQIKQRKLRKSSLLFSLNREQIIFLCPFTLCYQVSLSKNANKQSKCNQTKLTSFFKYTEDSTDCNQNI